MSLFHDGNPVAGIATMITWFGLLASSLAARKGFEKKSSIAKRDTRSVYGVALQGIASALTWFGPMRFNVDFTPAVWLAALPAAIVAFSSLGLFIWSQRTMGTNWSLLARTREDHSLVQGGPFALMRNPIYVAIYGLIVATAMSLGHEITLVVTTPLYVLGTIMRVRMEEKLLRETFGAAYDDYARRVKRFIPAVW